MAMISFPAGETTGRGYLALPPNGTGPGILVLHAWWGLNDFFKSLCELLAQNDFVAFAPDVYLGTTANTIEQAQKNLEKRDLPAMKATAEAAVTWLAAHRAVSSRKLGALGFSMGASYALELDSAFPDAFAAIVLFYGEGGADLSASRARFLGHYGENDEWESLDDVKKMNAPNAEIVIYPGAGHWFFESDRQDAYQPAPAAQAWARTLEFFKRNLK